MSSSVSGLLRAPSGCFQVRNSAGSPLPQIIRLHLGQSSGGLKVVDLIGFADPWVEGMNNRKNDSCGDRHGHVHLFVC